MRARGLGRGSEPSDSTTARTLRPPQGGGHARAKHGEDGVALHSAFAGRGPYKPPVFKGGMSNWSIDQQPVQRRGPGRRGAAAACRLQRMRCVGHRVWSSSSDTVCKASPWLWGEARAGTRPARGVSARCSGLNRSTKKRGIPWSFLVRHHGALQHEGQKSPHHEAALAGGVIRRANGVQRIQRAGGFLCNLRAACSSARPGKAFGQERTRGRHRLGGSREALQKHKNRGRNVGLGLRWQPTPGSERQEAWQAAAVTAGWNSLQQLALSTLGLRK